MDDREDPALQFFPSGKVDLYAALEVASDASQEQIKKAYKRLALRYHPDKVLSGHLTSSSSSSAQATAAERFQQIGFAYSVLSDEGRRKRFEDTGRTDESSLQGVDWEAYFKDLWQGEVTAQAIEDFKKGYRDSTEERSDILAAYRDSKGSLPDILNAVPCLEVLEDEERVIGIVESAIKAKEVKRLAGWDKSTSDDKARRSMRANARKEAVEAEEYAKELGVWDELFGKSKGKKAKAGKRGAEGEAEGDGEGHDEDEEAPKPRKKATSSKRSKKEAKEDDEDTGGLAALIAARQAARSSGLDDMIARLEAEAKGGKGKKGKGRR